MKQLFALTFLCLSLSTDIQAQVKADDFSERFFSALNSYKGTELNNMLGFDFTFRNTAVQLRGVNDNKAFEAFFTNAQQYRKQYIIKKVMSLEGRCFLVEEQGEYPRALGVAYPEFIFTLTPDEQGQLGALDIDTTKSYPAYQHRLHEKSARFERWRKKKMMEPGGLEKYGDIRPERLSVILKEYEKER